MKTSLLTGPLLLLAWQAAPVTTVRDSTGRTHLSFGFGAGQFEDRVYSCEGQLVSATPAKYQTGGAVLEHWPTPKIRFNAFGGAITSPNDRFAGPFGGLGVAYEGGIIGLGAGASVVPLDSQLVGAPQLYVRVGGLNRLHFRGDMFGSEAAFGTTGMVRVGLAGNQGLLRGPRWFAGISMPLDARGKYGGGGFGELAVPVSPRVDLQVGLAFRESAQYRSWGVSGGIRYGF